jgi:hypothetical protein
VPRTLAIFVSISLVACGGHVDRDLDSGPALDAPTGADVRGEIDTGADAGPIGRRGRVRLEGHVLHDFGGPFPALGVTLFWALWGYHEDRPRLERNLRWIADHGFHYIRVLGVVGDPAGADYWDGREADWRWPDYDAAIAGLTDLAWNEYGLRVEWTLIGDGQVAIPDEADRYSLVDRFLAMSIDREQQIIQFEIANEAWQNGFDGDPGNAQLQALSRYMQGRTEILVSASAPADRSCAGIDYVYAAPGDVGDVVTYHFDRDIGQEEGNWRPVWQPWTIGECGRGWIASNNEPIGSGSSVATEGDPTRLAASALVTWVSGVPFYVFHSRAGVRGDLDVETMPGADAFANVVQMVPTDLAGWDRREGTESDAPFRFYAEDAGGTLVEGAYWMDVAEPPRSGVVRTYSALRGNDFVMAPIGIMGAATFEARRALEVDIHDPISGALLETRTLAAGERTTLSAAGGALWLRGRFL